MTALALSERIGLILGLLTLVGILVSWVKWWRPKYLNGKREAVAIRDAILGRDAVRDTITGKELAPSLPGIGQRMATVEQALVTLADNAHRLGVVEDTQDEHAAHIAENRARIEALEASQVERIVTRAESVAAYRAMEEAIKADPEEER